MEIGTKVKWAIKDRIMSGIFVQITDDNLAEVVCYKMGSQPCYLKVFIDPSLLQEL